MTRFRQGLGVASERGRNARNLRDRVLAAGAHAIGKCSQTALRAGFGNAGPGPKKRRQISVNRGRTVDSRQISGRLEARKNGVGDLASRNTLLSVA